MKLNEYEIRHNAYLRENGAECAVLLKKDGNFPLKNVARSIEKNTGHSTGQNARQIAVYGSGARYTIKGGTGSGEVNSRFYVTIEEGLKNAGFTITSQSWLDGYDKVRAEAKQQFIKGIKAEAREKHTQAVLLCMGRSMAEPEYQLPIDGAGDTAVYVLSRISGEGSDREPTAGEILLSETEKRDILACNAKYRNFMLVINAGGVVDLTAVKDVKNILILSQLGVETGNILADILLGKSCPSGKLTTTWSAWKDYPSMIEFGDRDETRYKEGIYVGYRYFDSVGKKPLYPFGYGLSYTDFSLEKDSVQLNGERVTVTARVKNVGKFSGKEVLQVYVSSPEGKLDQPYQALVGFAKTKLLASGEEQKLFVSFDLSDIASYNEELASYVLEAGDYVLRAGNSSADTAVYGVIRVEESIVCIKARNVFGKPDFSDYKPAAGEKKSGSLSAEELEQTTVLTLAKNAIATNAVDFELDCEIDEDVKKLSDEQLIKMNLGAFDAKGGMASIIGNAGFTVAGAAGQTFMGAKEYGIPSMVMADGPAGLRLSREYARDKNGVVHALGTPFPESLADFLSGIAKLFMKQIGYKVKKTDTVENQYATAIPIGTAIAQSFNLEFAEKCGDIVGFEMELFGVHLWLASAMNIHRSIRCGRNFEYFSEDPVISGEFAAAITRGVQAHPGCGTTIKHYAANNQERNRTQNNSQASERALREIYLKGFGIAVRKSQPRAVMTSYNLINGIHTAEHKGMIHDVLKCEFGYQGIVMTDWTIANYATDKDCVHPVAKAPNVIMAGG
ncbi:MAG: glycoside hydrolase family 3 C-terminal domain-containing protein, partial [Lachnospiraceae bacterium]|nr:glycoside hydrolase family 3 C-terminal domain-containing protein [Lachnospiraceae bacterium]